MAPHAATVLLLNGAGDVSASWLPVIRGVGASRHVVALDRAGADVGSVAGDRDLADYTAELVQVIDDVAVGRVVLVGHSFGGLLARVYAELHRDRVAGMVLLDATPETVAFDRAVAAGLGASAAAGSMLKASAPLGLVRLLLHLGAMPLYPEQRDFEASASPEEVAEWKEAVDARFRTGTAVAELRSVLPAARAAVAILAQPSTSPIFPIALVTSRAYGAKWVSMQDDIAAKYGGSSHTSTGHRLHNIHMSHPQLVVDAVKSVLCQVAEPGEQADATEGGREVIN